MVPAAKDSGKSQIGKGVPSGAIGWRTSSEGLGFLKGRGCHPGVLFVRVANTGLTDSRVKKSEEE
jgi:hypothetical protein